jgi:hypothetical protein
MGLTTRTKDPEASFARGGTPEPQEPLKPASRNTNPKVGAEIGLERIQLGNESALAGGRKSPPHRPGLTKEATKFSVLEAYAPYTRYTEVRRT